MVVSWTAFIGWYRPSSEDAPTTARVFRRTRRLKLEARVLVLADAAHRDALDLSEDPPASALEHLAVVAVSVEAIAGRPLPGVVATLVSKVLGGASLGDALGTTDDEQGETLHAVLAAIVELDVIGGVERDCLQEAISHAYWGFHNTLAGRVPVFVELLLAGVDRANFAATLSAAAVLRAFATNMAVPTARERTALVGALTRSSLVAREDGVHAFVTALCNGACFYELAAFAAATCHEELLATFVAIAPERPVVLLYKALAGAVTAEGSPMIGQA